jgi:hypothetical protein
MQEWKTDPLQLMFEYSQICYFLQMVKNSDSQKLGYLKLHQKQEMMPQTQVLSAQTMKGLLTQKLSPQMLKPNFAQMEMGLTQRLGLNSLLQMQVCWTQKVLIQMLELMQHQK